MNYQTTQGYKFKSHISDHLLMVKSLGLPFLVIHTGNHNRPISHSDFTLDTPANAVYVHKNLYSHIKVTLEICLISRK